MKLGRLCLSVLMLSLMLFASGGLAAQNRVYAGLGINAGYARLDTLNYVLLAFNGENTWLEKPLRAIHIPQGVNFHIGADLNGFLLDLGYTMRHASRSGKGDGSIGEGSQVVQLRYNASTFDLGLGAFFVRRPRLRMALGGSMDVGNLRVSARRGLRDEIVSQPYGRYLNELNAGASVFLHTIVAFGDGLGPGIFIRPFYQFGLIQNDFGPLNRALRPSGSVSESYYLLGRQTNYGLKLGLYFGA